MNFQQRYKRYSGTLNGWNCVNFKYIIRIKGSSCYTLAQIFPEFLACEQALYLGDIVKRRRAGDTREERAGRRGFAAPSGVLASLASLAQMGELPRRLLNTIHKGLLVWFGLEGETIFEGDGRRGTVDNPYESLIIENFTYWIPLTSQTQNDPHIIKQGGWSNTWQVCKHLHVVSYKLPFVQVVNFFVTNTHTLRFFFSLLTAILVSIFTQCEDKKTTFAIFT